MYFVDLFKRLLKTKNIGVIIYLIINVYFVVVTFGILIPHSNTTVKIIGGILLYLLSIIIALSPFGEFILRYKAGCKEIKRIEYKEKLFPLFDEVYRKAKELDSSLPDDVQLYMSNSKYPNAFATGRKTICITKGLLDLPDGEIKSIIAHEFGHLANKDTDLLLLITVGNFVVMLVFVIIRIIILTVGYGVTIFSRSWGAFITTRVIDFIYVGAFSLWTWLGTMLVLHSSRKQEFEADKFAFDLGYGNELASGLDTIAQSDYEIKGIFATLMSTHPETDDRIHRLQEMGATYRKS